MDGQGTEVHFNCASLKYRFGIDCEYVSLAKRRTGLTTSPHSQPSRGFWVAGYYFLFFPRGTLPSRRNCVRHTKQFRNHHETSRVLHYQYLFNCSLISSSFLKEVIARASVHQDPSLVRCDI